MTTNGHGWEGSDERRTLNRERRTLKGEAWRRLFPPVGIPVNPGVLSVVNGVETTGLAGGYCACCSVMKMLLASSDLPALQAVARRLVASGIPIALCKDSDISSCPEVWIQRDSDFSLARKLLVEGVVPVVAAQAPVNRPCPGSPQRSGAGRRGVAIVTSGIGRCVRWLRQLRQA